MFTASKIILPVFALFWCMSALNARQTPAVLPSLLNNQTNKNATDHDNTMEALLKQKMFVKVFTNKNKIFVGEPVMAVYKFYVAMNINDQPTVTKQPEFSGCSVKELNFDQGPELENINNEPYAVYTIRKVQLTPLQQGMLSLGNASVNNTIEVLNPDDVYSTERFNITVHNTDMTIEVNELPVKNKPADFYGLTGTYTITAAAPKDKIPVGETGHLIVTIKGSGNFDAISRPEILWPANIEHFEGDDSQHVDQGNFPLSGYRVFNIPFIGKTEGIVMIPPVKFSFFNTSSKDYQTINTDSITITFSKALATKDEFTNVVNYDITNRQYLWIVPAIAVAVALIGFISYRRNKKTALKATAVTSTTAPPVFIQPPPVYHIKYRTDFSRYLKELESKTDNKTFFTKAKELLTKAVAERIDSNQYSEQFLLAELKQRTYDAPVCNKVDVLYKAFNLNLYAPYETQADLDLYFTELKQVIEELQAEA